jgi:hypothetical protein
MIALDSFPFLPMLGLPPFLQLRDYSLWAFCAM